MVPRAEEPPGVELTDQETFLLEAFETVAENAREAPARTLAEVGAMEMETELLEGGIGFEVVEEELLQELRANRAAKMHGSRRERFEREDMIRNSFGRGGGEGQLDGRPEMGQESDDGCLVIGGGKLREARAGRAT